MSFCVYSISIYCTYCAVRYVLLYAITVPRITPVPTGKMPLPLLVLDPSRLSHFCYQEADVYEHCTAVSVQCCVPSTIFTPRTVVKDNSCSLLLRTLLVSAFCSPSVWLCMEHPVYLQYFPCSTICFCIHVQVSIVRCSTFLCLLLVLAFVLAEEIVA